MLLEVCPTSNWLCRSVESYDVHPMRKILDAGVACAFGTDDPGLFGTGQGDEPEQNITLNKEYELVSGRLGITRDELMLCNERAVAASFLPADERRRVWKGSDVK